VSAPLEGTKPELEPEQKQPPRRGLARLLAWAHNLFGSAILLGFVYYVWAHRSEFTGVSQVSFGELSLLVAFGLSTLAFAAAQMWLLLRASDIAIGFGECFVLGCAAGFGNYLPMRAGTLIRAHYLKSVHGLRYARFAGVSGLRSIITVLATGALGLVGTVAVAADGGHLSVALLLGFFAMLVLPLSAWFVRVPERKESDGRLRRMFLDFLRGVALIREQPKASFWAFVWVILQELSMVARFYVATRATGGETALSLLLLLSPVAALASYAALTPGALGLREAAMGGATYAVGHTFSSGILLGTIDRVVFMAVTTVVGSFSFLAIWLKIRRVDRERALAAAR
jgi:uncharacterized membrane protein YbhN (UPF0104 family)